MAKVSQSIIDEFRKNGMAASIAKYKRGEGSSEFNEAIKRYYPSAAKDSPNPGLAAKPITKSDTNAIPKPETTRTGADYTYNPNKKTNIPNSSHNLAKVKAAAQRKSGKIADSKNGAEFAGRAARDITSAASKAVGWLGKNLSGAGSTGKSSTPKPKKPKSKGKMAI